MELNELQFKSRPPLAFHNMLAYIACMNSKHRRIVEAVFALPIRADIRFGEIESLMEAIGSVKLEGAGSRLKFRLGTAMLFCHRPHPKPELKPYQVKDVRQFLEKVGVTPDTQHEKE